jgi:hypothetical protein
MYLSNEMGRVQKKGALTSLRYNPDIFLEELRKITRIPSMIDVAFDIATGNLLNMFTVLHFLHSFRGDCQQIK